MPRIVFLALAVSFGVLACNTADDSESDGGGVDDGGVDDGGTDDGGVDDGGVDDGGTGNDACSYVSDFNVGFESIGCNETSVAVGQTVSCTAVVVGGETTCIALSNLADSTTGGTGCTDQGNGPVTVTADTSLGTPGEYVVTFNVLSEAGDVVYGLPGDDSGRYEILLFEGDAIQPEFLGPVGEDCVYITVTLTE